MTTNISPSVRRSMARPVSSTAATSMSSTTIRGGNSMGSGSSSHHRISNQNSSHMGAPRTTAMLSRPPILLSFTSLSKSSSHGNNDSIDNVVIEIGHVGQSRYKHIVELLPFAITNTAANSGSNNVITTSSDYYSIDAINDADRYYRMYTNALEHVFHLLGGNSSGGGTSGQPDSTKERRVIVLYNMNGLYIPRTWKMAISRILYEVIGIPAISYQSAICMIPFAMTPPAVSETINHNALLIVHITVQGAQCIIFADKMLLEYTYQSCGYPKSSTDDETSSSSLSMLDVKKMQSLWLNDDNHINTSLLITIIKTLEACPRQVRLAAINSIVFSGMIIDYPNFGCKIIKKLETILTLDNDNKRNKATGRTMEDIENDEPISTTTSSTTSSASSSTTYLPYNTNLLRPLADHIAMVQFGPQQIRPDLLPWIGTSAWCHHWHEQDPESKQLQWEYNQYNYNVLKKQSQQ